MSITKSKRKMTEKTFKNLIEEIKQLLDRKRTAFNAIEIGRLLERIKVGMGCKYAGYRNFDDWLASGKIGFKKRIGYYYLTLNLLWETRLKEALSVEEINSVEYSKLLKIRKELARAVDTKKIKQLLRMARRSPRTEMLTVKKPLLSGIAQWCKIFRNPDPRVGRQITITRVKFFGVKHASEYTLNKLYRHHRIKFRIEITDLEE